MSRTRAFEWHKRFKEGWGEVEDNPWSGRPSTSRTADNIERVKQMVRSDRRLMVRMIAKELSINKDTVCSVIIENLEMRKVYAKMVPKLLSKDQKQKRVTVCHKTLSSASRTIQTYSGESLQEMNRGYSNTILRPNGRVVSGKVWHHQNQRKQGCRSRRSR